MGTQTGSCSLALWGRTVEKRGLRDENEVSGQEGHPEKALAVHNGVSRVGNQGPASRVQGRA